MRRRRTPAQPRKTTRRWHIPPPLVHGPEALECGNILDEWSGEIGVVLWQSLRDVLLWSGTAPPDRGSLFHENAEQKRLAAILTSAVDEKVEGALRTLAGMVGDPVGMRAETVAVACRQVAQWAEARGALDTALAFAQDAALACPGDATAAFAVARLARVRTDHARAEVWFRRAIGLARQSRDWRTYSESFRGLGNLYMLRGNFPLARRFLVRALRGARRGGMRAEQGSALHDLFALEINAGRSAAAEQFARQAFEAYGARNPRLPRLAHDLAYLWMDRGYFGRALPIFEALLPVFTKRRDRIFVLADIARAAAGAGNPERFLEVRAEVAIELADGTLAEFEPRVLLELARGASSVGMWDAAADAAERAMRLAADRAEAKVVFTAEALLESVRGRQALVTHAEEPEDSTTYQQGEQLASDVSEALRTLTTAAA